MAVPKGKLVKLSSAPVIIKPELPTPPPGQDGKDGVAGPPGLPGTPGEAGKDGRDAPTLEEILNALRDDPSLSQLVVKEVGKQTLGAVIGGEGKFNVTDLPGYRNATPGQILGVGSNKKVGFYDPETLGILPGEAEVQYKRLIDTVGNYKYVGEALPGTATSASTWRVKRIEFLAGDDVDILWAAGTAEFTRSWDNRLSESYS